MSVAEPNLFISTSGTDRDAVQWLNAIFLDLAENGVSDLHLLALQDNWEIRIRSPQGMRHLGYLPRDVGETVSDRIRSRANLSLSDRRSPMDGRFRLRYDDRAVDVRVAITPNIMGSLIVCRILDQARSVISLEGLNLDPRYLMALRSLLTEPNGIFFITGPTGSGKTTTLYALVNELNDGTRNIVTVENPVEYVVPGIAQINVDHTHTTFPNALRTVLRQDPDVILVGEIRDSETAQIAVQAAMTGHLVLATLHTNSAIQAPFRMLDLGIDPKMLSVATRGVCAQRLLPMAVQPPDGFSDDDWQPLSASDDAWSKLQAVPCLGQRVLRPGVKTKGYLPAMELFLMDDAARDAVSHSDLAKLRDCARSQPWYDTLAQSASFASFRGLCLFQEARKLISNSDSSDAGTMRIASKMIDTGLLTLDQAMHALEQQVYWRLQGRQSQFGEVLSALEAAEEEAALALERAPSGHEESLQGEDIPGEDPETNGSPNTPSEEDLRSEPGIMSVADALAIRPSGAAFLPKAWAGAAYLAAEPVRKTLPTGDAILFDITSKPYGLRQRSVAAEIPQQNADTTEGQLDAQ